LHDEDKVLAVLREAGVKRGVYMFPSVQDGNSASRSPDQRSSSRQGGAQEEGP
jgi:hypothetical protein